MKINIALILAYLCMNGYMYACEEDAVYPHTWKVFDKLNVKYSSDEQGTCYTHEVPALKGLHPLDPHDLSFSKIRSSYNFSEKGGEVIFALKSGDLRALEVQYCRKALALQPRFVAHRGKIGLVAGLALGFGATLSLLKFHDENESMH